MLPLLNSNIEKGRKEFAHQANRYHDLLEPLLAEGGDVQRITKMAPVLGYSIAFSQACFGIAAVTSAITGIAAQRALNEFHAKLGADVSGIRKNQELMADIMSAKELGEHVFHSVDMHSQRLHEHEFKTGRKQFTWVYHRGNDWHWPFNKLQKERDEQSQCNSWLTITWACLVALVTMLSDIIHGSKTSKGPIHLPVAPVASVGPRFIGYFDNLSTLTGSMQVVRKIVGPDADFHILLPTTELTVLNDPLSFPSEVHPLTLTGELHSRTGSAYYGLNMPGAPKEMFRHVHNLAIPEPKKPEPSLGRKAAAVSASIGAGVGGGIAGGAAGLIATGIGCVIFTPAAPLALLGILTVGVLGGGAAAGTASALSAGEAVEKVSRKRIMMWPRSGFERSTRLLLVEALHLRESRWWGGQVLVGRSVSMIFSGEMGVRRGLNLVKKQHHDLRNERAAPLCHTLACQLGA
jgi:hypothetical protein